MHGMHGVRLGFDSPATVSMTDPTTLPTTTADYYHEIARAALELADEHTDAVAAAYGDDKGGMVDPDDIEGVKKAIQQTAEHGVFTDGLGSLWTHTGTTPEEAAGMGRIIVLSRARFVDRQSGEPRKVLRDAAAATIEEDLRNATFDIIAKRLETRGYDVRR